ncbi:uncharacterized protein L203_104354 [Cryptococcus depauperatus CBS 7841]|uniref:Uncharacterized protein n=1 Tax=Cryptococcus depauperatus CBS 7841 TaxID=1295531 RepID=A0A1E3IFX3_9TREE|nr:hypothetical protein L203_03289 [Cryptococcus depauperatus CBS 7841]
MDGQERLEGFKQHGMPTPRDEPSKSRIPSEFQREFGSSTSASSTDETVSKRPLPNLSDTMAVADSPVAYRAVSPNPSISTSSFHSTQAPVVSGRRALPRLPEPAGLSSRPEGPRGSRALPKPPNIPSAQPVDENPPLLRGAGYADVPPPRGKLHSFRQPSTGSYSSTSLDTRSATPSSYGHGSEALFDPSVSSEQSTYETTNYSASHSTHESRARKPPDLTISGLDDWEGLLVPERYGNHFSEQNIRALKTPDLEINSRRATPTQNSWLDGVAHEKKYQHNRDRSVSAVTMKADGESVITPRGERLEGEELFPSTLEKSIEGLYSTHPIQDNSCITRHGPGARHDLITSLDSTTSPVTPIPSHARHTSSSSLLSPISQLDSADLSPSWTSQTQTPSHWVERKLQIHQSHRNSTSLDTEGGYQHEGPSGYEDEEWEEDEAEGEVDEGRFFQPAFLSEMALQLRDKISRAKHIKAGIAWVGSFTGKDIVTTIHNLLPLHTREDSSDRRFALLLAQSLQNQLWFVEVDWDIKPLRDSSDDVFRFMGEMEGMGSGGDALTSELPMGLMTMATKCYSPSCTGDSRCYAPRCPYKTAPDTFLPRKEVTPLPTPASAKQGDWKDSVDPILFRNLSQREISRQDIIRQALSSEVAYEAELSSMESLFILNLRIADPPVILNPSHREWFIHEVFHSVLELRDISRSLIEEFTIRTREQSIIPFVGDLFLQAATEWRNVFPEYTGRLPQAEAVLSKELEENTEFRLYAERVVRENDRRRDIKHLLTRPSAQLQRYPALIEGILNLTDDADPDRDFLDQALQAIQDISSLSQLKLFHASKGRGVAGKLQWYDLVNEDARKSMDKKEMKRQMHIWELISTEMEYVADLEAIDSVFVDGLRSADSPIIDRNRLDVFLDDAFHNYRSLLEVHSRLLENLQHRQIQQHPNVGMISDLIFDAALNWQEAYMEYVTHYPIAKAKAQDEERNNPKFAQFLKDCMRDPATNRQDIYHFINRPIPRLLRYQLLLSDILSCLKHTGPPDHPDIDQIPQVIEVISDLAKATQKGVALNEAKVELWGMQKTLDGSRFGPRMVRDLELENPMRELIHKGRVYRQPEGSIGGGWTELIVLLFDHYLVLTKEERASRSSRSSKKDHRKVQYIINRRPIPLELLTLGNFGDPPRQRTTNRLFGSTSHEPSADGQSDTSKLYPFTISFIGGQEQGQFGGGSYVLWADSYVAREEWKERLQHAKVLRSEVDDAGKVFELNPLSVDTFYMPPNYSVPKDKEDQFTGRVTCSCPFATIDQRRLVAVGCQDGVWIGIRGDARSLRKVLHVKNVTSIAVLEEFSIFLCLSDKSLVAYQLEALVPTKEQKQVKTTTERISMPKEEITSFTVGRLEGRTLVVLMKVEATKSVFKILEPVLNRNMEDTARQRRPFGFLGRTSEWFRPYKMFYLPAEVYGVTFLKRQLAILCSKGFETMDLAVLQGGSIPVFDPAKFREKPILSELKQKCDTGKPLGMFRSTENEFLLVYDTFGLYIERYGDPSRDCRPIEWEGRHDTAAFHPPYLLLISGQFIETRHIDTGKLLQIYTGKDLRCTWDGLGGQKNPPVLNPGKHGYGDETKIQEPQIHICQRATDYRQGRGLHPIGQNVFELSPTLLLNNPLLNPASNVYDSNYVPPPPLTRHATPQIRQARPPSITTTESNEFHSNPNMFQQQNISQGYLSNPDVPSHARMYSNHTSHYYQQDGHNNENGAVDYRNSSGYSRDSGSIRQRDSGSINGYGPSQVTQAPYMPAHQQMGHPQQNSASANYTIPEHGQGQEGYGYGPSAIRAWAQGGGYSSGPRAGGYGGYD